MGTNRHDGKQRYVFVCGTPRSGTTLLAKVFGSNGQVVLGIERFKRLLGCGYVPELFVKDRFFDFQVSDTNARYEAYRDYYESARRKFEDARYIGDKIPNLYKRISQVNDAFSGEATFVFCYRNLFEVAASWNARAQNPKDRNWPEANDYREAVKHWNDSFRQALQAKQRGIDLIPFSYNAFVDFGLSSGKAYYVDFLRELGLPLGQADEEVLTLELTRLPKIRARRVGLAPEMITFLEAHVEVDLIRRFIRRFHAAEPGLLDSIVSCRQPMAGQPSGGPSPPRSVVSGKC